MTLSGHPRPKTTPFHLLGALPPSDSGTDPVGGALRNAPSSNRRRRVVDA